MKNPKTSFILSKWYISIVFINIWDTCGKCTHCWPIHFNSNIITHVGNNSNPERETNQRFQT
jgi:hypothetical protein